MRRGARRRASAGGLQAKLGVPGVRAGFLYKFLMAGLKLWKEYPSRSVQRSITGASISAEVVARAAGRRLHHRAAHRRVPVGRRRARVPGADPAISSSAPGSRQPLFAATKLIADMSPGEIRSDYVLYIGAGAVAAGGIIALCGRCPRSSARSAPASRTCGRQRRRRGRAPPHRARPADLGHARRLGRRWRCC